MALGGGVVTDMTGFTASSWMRGIRWVGVPTTLLAMVDASTGGKTGVDFGPAKNAVGAFWQPCGVVCDVELEATEPLPRLHGRARGGRQNGVDRGRTAARFARARSASEWSRGTSTWWKKSCGARSA